MSYVYTTTGTVPVLTTPITPITYPTTTTGTGLQWNGAGNFTIATNPNLEGTTLKVKGDADFEGDVTIKGKSIKESLEKIEEKLAILHPNEALEKKWEKLRGLRKMYMELEQEIIEKEKMWEILKK